MMAADRRHNHPGALLDASRIAEELSNRGLEWADTDAAYKALDDSTKTVLSEAIIDYLPTCKSVAEAETRARASQTYKDHIAALSAARRAANRAKVKYEVYKAYLDLSRTNASTERALIGLS